MIYIYISDSIPPTAGVRQASPSARTRAEAQKADEARLLGNTANLIGGADVTIAPKKGSAASIAKFNDLELPESATSFDEISVLSLSLSFTRFVFVTMIACSRLLCTHRAARELRLLL